MGGIGDNYVTLDQIKDYVQIPLDHTNLDARLNDAIASASREIEQFTGRQFNKTDIATPRLYSPRSLQTVNVDDFWSEVDLIIEVDHGNGLYDEVVAPSSYELLPLSGVVDGNPGWPYERIRLPWGGLPYRTRRWSHGQRSGSVRVTAKWGWPIVPASVKQATLILAAQTFKLADAPLGVAGMDSAKGTNFTSGGVVRVRDIPAVASKLNRFVSNPIMVG
jgi:hypothetical protein